MRNFLIHGETWEGAFKGKPRQPYRVGLVKKNLEYLDEFERAATVRTSLTSSRCVMRPGAALGFTGILQRCGTRLPRPPYHLKKKSRRLRDQLLSLG